MMTEERLPVVLLGGLDIVRALGRAGIPVIIASSERRTPSMASRYCAGVIELPPFSDRKAVLRELVLAGQRLAAHYGTTLPLFYDNDDRLALVQDFRLTLAPCFKLLLNSPELGAALLDKARFQALAERRGLPVPRRIDWSSLAAEPGPVLVKPKLRTGWERSRIQQQLFGGEGKARIFASGAEAAADPLLAELAAQLSFQEYVAGGDDAIRSFHGFAAPGGEVLAWFVGRKIRTFPPLTGDSAYVRLEDNPAIEALGRDIAARLQLAGVFKMDFKHERLLEINTRFNLWHYVGAMNGVNLPAIAHQWLTQGRRPEPRRAATRYRWLSLRYDFRACRALGLGARQWLGSLLEAPKVYELFAWTDPLPFVRYWSARLRGALTRRVDRWLATAS